jgi:DNA-binding HxlR family transcriptional regulator
MSSGFPFDTSVGYHLSAMAKPIDPTCRAFQSAIDLLARPWTGLILGLLQERPLRFSEIESRADGVGAKTLSARLKELESRSVVERRVEPGPPVRVTYALTARGKAFESVAAAIERWGRVLAADATPTPRGPKLS